MTTDNNVAQKASPQTCGTEFITWRYFLVRAFTCPVPGLGKSLPVIGGRTLVEFGTLAALFATAFYFTNSVEGKVAGGRVDYFGLIMIIFAARNNVLTWAFGVSFERAIFFHKALAITTLVALSIHASHSGNNTTGIAIVTLFTFNTALYAAKPYLFELFYYLHMGVFVGIIVATYFHGARLIPFAGVAWGFDLLIRYVLNLKSVQAEGFLLPGDIVKIQFNRSFDYEPGQYCFIRVGDIANLEFHPFSLSTAPHQAKTSIHIRALGDWTKRLRAKIESSVPQRDAEAGPPGVVAGVPLRVSIEGPFGVSMVNFRDPRYTVFLLISGGIGVTPNQSILNHLVADQRAGRALRKVFFVWSVKDRALMDTLTSGELGGATEEVPALPLSFQPPPVAIREAVDELGTERLALAFTAQGGEGGVEMVGRAVQQQDTAHEPSAHQKPLDSPAVFHSEYYLSAPRAKEEYVAGGIHPNVQSSVRFGRPDMLDLFERTKALCEQEGIARVAVFVCGPAGLVAATCDTAVAMSRGCCQGRGVKFDCHSEVFDL